MDMEFIQVSVLAIIQGITEFLPISSSGHLIIPTEVWGWPDQGLVFDVAVHLGSLTAVVYYFRLQIIELVWAGWQSIAKQQHTTESKLAWFLILATIPAGLTGFLLNDYVEQYARSIALVGSTSIVFGLLLYISDGVRGKKGTLKDITWKAALFIGMAQVLALLPGTSRSGITMTAGLMMNLSRHAASQFSFLLAIPIIAASALLELTQFYQVGATTSDWLFLLYGTLLSAVVSYFCIHYFLQLIQKLGFLPFVVYRVLLGMVLLGIYFF